MVSAVILLVVEKSKINEVAEQLVELPGITEVYSVAGQYDLVAVARVRDNEGIAAAVTNQMLKIEGIRRTETLIAFRAFSRYNLERMFSVGLEEPPAAAPATDPAAGGPGAPAGY
jgi:DNA-binding Lrp family transcriptional regulator